MVEVYQVRPRLQKAQELTEKNKQLEITELIRPKIISKSPEVIKPDRTKEVAEFVRPNRLQEVSASKEINKLPEAFQLTEEINPRNDYLERFFEKASNNQQITNPRISRGIDSNSKDCSDKIASFPINEVAKDLRDDRRHQKMVEGSNWGDVYGGVIASDEYWGFLESYE